MSLPTTFVSSGHVIACLDCKNADLFFVPVEPLNYLKINYCVVCNSNSDCFCSVEERKAANSEIEELFNRDEE